MRSFWRGEAGPGAGVCPLTPPLHPSGLIVLNCNTTYYLRPRAPGDPKEASTHTVFRIQQLLTWEGACGHRDPREKAGMTSRPTVSQNRVRAVDRVAVETQGKREGTLGPRARA